MVPGECGLSNDSPRVVAAQAADAGQNSDSSKVPGPGIVESILWTLACPISQVFGSVVFLLGLTGYVFATQGGAGGEAVKEALKANHSGYIAVVQAFFVLFAIAAVTIRVGRPWANRLNLSPIDPLHFVLMVVLVIPLASFSTGFYAVGSEGWRMAVDAFPVLAEFDQVNTMEQIAGFASSMSLPLMLLLVAVAPAVGEELIFRGLIGRGLTARCGWFRGIAITSVLFAAAHLHPAHAFGVIPLGVAMHLAYVSTKSFWAPVFVHFSNNAMATLVAKSMKAEDLEQAAKVSEVSVLPIVVGGLLVVAILALMWQTRVRHKLTDGTWWDPGYPTVERPPIDLDAKVSRAPAHWLGLVAVGAAAFGFLAISIESAKQAAL